MENLTRTTYSILASTIYNGISKFYFLTPKVTFAYIYVLHCFYHEVPKIRDTAFPAMI